jgi:2-aminoadipate transaminase
VLVEQPTYFVFLEMLSGLGIRPVSLPAGTNLEYDFERIEDRLAELKRSGEIGRVKAIYLMSYFANPSGVCRGAREKRELAELLLRFDLNVPVIEDAAYRDLWFDEPWPVPGVLCMCEWESFSRLYLGTLTKPYSSGLKVGYAHASDGELLDRMNWAKGHHDFGTANFNQAILEKVLTNERFDHHLERLSRSYRAKMYCLHDALEGCGLRKAGWEWERPGGGLNLWARAPEGVNTSLDGPFWKACIEAGVFYVPGSLCFGDSSEERYVRLSFGVLDHASLERAAERFASAATATNKVGI